MMSPRKAEYGVWFVAATGCISGVCLTMFPYYSGDSRNDLFSISCFIFGTLAFLSSGLLMYGTYILSQPMLTAGQGLYIVSSIWLILLILSIFIQSKIFNIYQPLNNLLILSILILMILGLHHSKYIPQLEGLYIAIERQNTQENQQRRNILQQQMERASSIIKQNSKEEKISLLQQP